MTVGGHWLQVAADAQYDVDTSNNRSEVAYTEVLTNRDITLGFRGYEPTREIIVETSRSRIRSAGERPEDIAVLNGAPAAAAERQLAQPQEIFSVGPLPPSAQTSQEGANRRLPTSRPSPSACAQQRRWTLGVRIDGELCPGVWALVR